MSSNTHQPTEHGRNIAGEINGTDAYGQRGNLNLADVALIIDYLHTNFCDQEGSPEATTVMPLLEKWLDEVIEKLGGLPL